MIKYYSTLKGKMYDSEQQAKFEEEDVVDKYFRDIETEAERIRRARSILMKTSQLSYTPISFKNVL